MRKSFLILFLLVAGLVALVDGEPIKNEDILPDKVIEDLRNNLDCNGAGTRDDQLRLFYKYRGLYDYRRFHSSNAAEDFEKQSGTVVMLNYQEEVIHLKCPCKGEVRSWEQFGEGIESTTFNDIWKKDAARSHELNVKRPTPQSYYRTIGCFTKNRKNYHYFNIFTRPGIQTDFPVSFREEEKGDRNDRYWRCYLRVNTKEKMKCAQKPYTFSWIMPSEEKDPSKPIRRGPEPGEGIPEPNSTLLIDKAVVVKDPTDKERVTGNLPCYKVKSWQTCKAPLAASYIRLTVEKITKYIAGVHECVVTDRNGLSTSFRYENLDGKDKPMVRIDGMRFGGFVHVHIRGFIYVIIPIVIIVVIFVLTILCVWACPDNREEYEEQLREQAEMRRIENRRMTAAPTAVVSAAPSTTNSPEPPPKPSVVIPNETESMMHQMAGVASPSPAVKRKTSKKTTTTRGDKEPKVEEPEASVHSGAPHKEAHHKKKKKHHPKP